MSPLTTFEPLNTFLKADHSGRAVRVLYCLLLPETGIVGSNPTEGMDVCVCLICVCVVLRVGSGLATG
jgi:hypothetical protein